MPWRYLVTPPLSGAENMALDETLLARARDTGESVLRIYTWLRPTLSLGRNQTARGLYDIDVARDRGIDIVRRPTGGRAILHHHEVTYSVTAPTNGKTLRQAYGAINRLLLDGLSSLGVAASIAERVERASQPGITPCFESPGEGELVVDGRKLVGSAQYREDGAYLQHGSILVEDDQTTIATLCTAPVPPVPAPATLHGALGRVPTTDEVVEALVGALLLTEDDDATSLHLDDAFLSRARDATARYASDGWTWRR
jgi:lipoyl(octanoyl) transferase